MTVTVRSFAKINLGLRLGARRPDGFHDLLTIYQTIGLHDLLRVSVARGSGIEIACVDPRVPKDASNTCYRVAEKTLAALGKTGRVRIEIEKRLPVQGGLGGASANAIATMLGLERGLKTLLPAPEKLRIAAEVGSDLSLFLIGGTILGLGRGEQVYPLPDLPATPCVVLTPEIGVSTPKAFARWDAMSGADDRAAQGDPKLTLLNPSDRINQLSRALSGRLGEVYSGAPFGRGRAENLLLELVRAGIANDFEEVVFPEYPELREAKRALDRAGAEYASLSGSGSTLYGLFGSKKAATEAASGLCQQGWTALATTTLTRKMYWQRIPGD